MAQQIGDPMHRRRRRCNHCGIELTEENKPTTALRCRRCVGLFRRKEKWRHKLLRGRHILRELAEAENLEILRHRLDVLSSDYPVSYLSELVHEVLRRCASSRPGMLAVVLTMLLKCRVLSESLPPPSEVWLEATGDKRAGPVGKLDRAMADWVLRHPGLCVDLLRELGYAVTPPARVLRTDPDVRAWHTRRQRDRKPALLAWERYELGGEA
jgi:hypothetical protein